MTPAAPDPLLRTAEVASWLNLSVPWLKAARRRNEGPPFVRLGARAVRYHRAAVQAWLDEKKTTTGALKTPNFTSARS